MVDEPKKIIHSIKGKVEEQGKKVQELKDKNISVSEEEEVIGDAPNIEELNARQEIFCRNYANNKEFFANGLRSYCDAYNLDPRDENDAKTARECASRLLKNVNVCQRISRLLDDSGLNDSFVDKQMLFVISQNENLNAKMIGVKEYNALRKRVTKPIELIVPDEDENVLAQVFKAMISSKQNDEQKKNDSGDNGVKG